MCFFLYSIHRASDSNYLALYASLSIHKYLKMMLNPFRLIIFCYELYIVKISLSPNLLVC